MLQSSTPGAGIICLRCWTRLVHSTSPRGPSARLLVPSQRRHASKATWLPEDDSWQTSKFGSPSVQAERERGLQGVELEEYKRKRRVQFTQYLKRKALDLRVAELSSDTPALGGKLPVVILRKDASVKKRTDELARDVEELTEAERREALEAEHQAAKELQSFIEARIHEEVEEDQAGPIPKAEDEVDRNLDGLWPDVARTELPRKDLDALAKDLHSGFSYEQLRRYANKVTEARTAREQQQRDTTRGARPNEQGVAALQVEPWQIGTTSFDRPLPSAAQSRKRWAIPASEVRNLKERMAWKIIRHGWGLVAEDEVGQLEIIMADPELSLFLSERRPLLKTIAGRRQVKIDVSRSRRALRITATRELANQVLRDVRAIHRNILYSDINTETLRRSGAVPKRGKNKFPSQAILESIARITGTEIGRRPDDDTLRVYSMGPDTTEEDDVRRLLVASVPLSEADRPQLHVDGAAPITTQAGLFTAGEQSELAWDDRERHWQRFQSAVEKKKKEEEKEEHEQHEGERKTRVEDEAASVLKEIEMMTGTKPASSPMLEDLRKAAFDFGVSARFTESTGSDPVESPVPAVTPAQQYSEDQAIWNPKVHTTIFALPGLVLHEASDATAGIVPSTVQAVLDRSANDRAFSHSVPRLAKAVASLDSTDRQPTKEQIHIHAIPSPWTNVSPRAFPSLRIIMDLDPETKSPRLASVHAIIQDHAIDLMRPHSAADLRFRHRSYVQLSRPDMSENIRRFLDQSHLDIRGQGRLRTPSSLSLSLPRWLQGLTEGKAPEQGDEGSEVEVDYLFARLDHRQLVELDLDGMKVEWVSVEGGLTGGRRGELRMYLEGDEAAEVVDV